jgi:thiol-disulfide isomerase/thioredoxin
MATKSTPSRTAPPPAKSRTPWIVGGVIALVVVVAAVVAIIASSGGGNGGGDDGSGLPPTSIGEVVAEMLPVEISGEALPTFASVANDGAIGMTAPTLKGLSFDQTPVDVLPGEGGPYMVVFLAHWCPHCNAEIPRLIEWAEGGGVPEGLQIVGVSTSVDANAPNYPPSEWIVDKGWPWPVMADSADRTAAQVYGVGGFPQFVIVGEDGTVLYRNSGEMGVEDIDAAVDQALGLA